MLFTLVAFGQEDCANGIDDDGDMLIDLNDPDCVCQDVVISGLIPNPSFEEMSCCPQSENQLQCAVTWIQASEPTTDYWHTCGAVCHNFTSNCAPLPPPDGEGFIGFRDGKPGNSNFKEYAGACLAETMEIGKEYTIDFFTGFASRPDGMSTSFEITLYATTDCGNLPFGQGNSNFGCPTNGSGWVQLDQITLSGNDQWINTVFTFVATQEYEAIVLGPGCDINPSFEINPYFFFDRLWVAESTEFEVPFAAIEGSVCDNSLTLFFDNDPTYNFQWYLDGVAIVGATGDNYAISHSDPDFVGAYSVLVTTPAGCFTSASYLYEVPEYETSIVQSICQGEDYTIGLETFTDNGFYQVPLVAADGCDSLVSLFLTVNDPSDELIEEVVCEGETFEILGQSFSDEGVFILETVNALGCDSTITLSVDLIEANEGLSLGNDLTISLGDSVGISPVIFDPDNVSYQWFNETGLPIGDMIDLAPFTPLSDQLVYLEVFDDNGCPAVDSINIRVDRDIALYVPNVFSPNNDGTNDDFLAYGNQSIVGLEEVYIYDRWGNLVYKSLNQQAVRNQPLFTWDGTFNGQRVETGVYVYTMTARVIDDTFISRSGDVTLVR